ncbi:MAG TPA: MBL fold metallo-hydrolase [Solirubrobacteraceae bacterium]|nr:MBL fold metallo-hydrolase [Solirubrobacteraceae bacterium]
MTARLTFVGSGDAFASGGRFQACLHLEADGTAPLLLDCGATALIALKRLGIDPSSIGHVALTHLHGDHFAGLPWLILDGQFAKRTKELVIAGPAGTGQRFEEMFEALYPGSPAAERPFETRFVEFEERVPLDFGPARITAYPVRHTPGTRPHGLRVEYANRVTAYSGDTEWTDTLPDIARGAELFVCECNFFDTKAPGHLDYQTLMQHRPELECKKIVITHMSEEMLARVDAGEIELEAATDGAVISV